MFGVFQLIPCILPILGSVSAVPFCLKPGFEHQIGLISPADFRETWRTLEFDPMLQAETLSKHKSPLCDPRMCESPPCFLNTKMEEAGALFRDKKMRHVSLA